MYRCTTLLILLFTNSFLFAQTEAEKEAIKQFCGCFKVNFEYKETFARDENYQYHEPYEADAVEYVVLVEERPGKLVLQNLLIIDDEMVIKHWRQDWEYQPATHFNFLGNKTWEVLPSANQGQWTQKVFEVDDSPRYSGTATWFLADGKKSWESTSLAPLPRREYTKRSDYHILRRNNRLQLTDWGWLHEQDNEKLVLDGTSERVLVEEKGRNVYRRVDEKNCQTAIEYWEKHKAFWQQVRLVWDEFLLAPGAYSLEKQVEGKSLHKELDALSELQFKDDQEARDAVRKLLGSYRSPVDTASN